MKLQKLQYLSMGNDMMQEKMEKGSMQYITCFLLCLYVYVCMFMFVLILLFIAYDTVFHFSFVSVQYSDMQ